MGLYLGVIIASIIGFTNAQTFVHSFNGSLCSLIDFAYHTVNGDDRTEFPRWIGVENIVKALDNMTLPLIAVQSDYSNTFESTTYNGLAQQSEDYNTLIESIPTDLYKGVTGVNGEDVYPLFTESFKDSDAIGVAPIAKEGEVLTTLVEKAGTMKEAANKVLTYKDKINNTIHVYEQKFIDMEDTVTNTAEPLVANFMSIRDKAFNLFLLAFKILYGFFVAFSVVLMALLTLYAIIKCFLLKLPVHILWNIVLLTCILTLIIGALMGILSFIFGTFSPVLTYLLSPEYMNEPNSVFKSVGDGIEYIDVCLNGDGDLARKLNVDDKAMEYILQFHNVSKEFRSYTDQITKESIVYENITSTLDDIKEDLTKATDSESYGENQIAKLLEEVNEKTSNGSPCGTYDYYTVNECKDGYELSTEYKISSVNKKYCYKIQSFTGELNYSAATCNYQTEFDNIKTYIKEVDKLLDDTKNTLTTKYQAKCNSLLKDIKKVYSTSSSMVDSIIEMVENAVGSEGDFYDMFRCNYIALDLIDFVNVFNNHFSHSCRDIGISCLCGCFFSYIGGYILLRAMYHYSPQAKKNANPDVSKMSKASDKKHLNNTGRIDTELIRIKQMKE